MFLRQMWLSFYRFH